MFDRVHATRWRLHFREMQFTSNYVRHHHLDGSTPTLRDFLRQPGSATYSLYPGSEYPAIPLWLVDKLLANRVRGEMLSRR
jgi:hypothetical protein